MGGCLSGVNFLGHLENVETGLEAKKTNNLVSKRKGVSKLSRVVRLESSSLLKCDNRSGVCVYT
jgi:hypothetical protein